MYKDFMVDGYKFHVNERGWGIVADNYNGGAIELSVSTMKKMIEVYEKEFPKRGNRASIKPIEDSCTISQSTLREVLLYEANEREKNRI